MGVAFWLTVCLPGGPGSPPAGSLLRWRRVIDFRGQVPQQALRGRFEAYRPEEGEEARCSSSFLALFT